MSMHRDNVPLNNRDPGSVHLVKETSFGSQQAVLDLILQNQIKLFEYSQLNEASDDYEEDDSSDDGFYD